MKDNLHTKNGEMMGIYTRRENMKENVHMKKGEMMENLYLKRESEGEFT